MMHLPHRRLPCRFIMRLGGRLTQPDNFANQLIEVLEHKINLLLLQRNSPRYFR